MPFEKVSNPPGVDFRLVNKAFTKQSTHYDEEDVNNCILQVWRKQIYQQVEKFLLPGSKILELNSGTGIDAVYFASKGHRVHCTDLSDGMIAQIQTKIQSTGLKDRLTCQQCSYDALNEVDGTFDFVFSNFGGLNCIDDLTKVTRHLPGLLQPGAMVTFVIMPPISVWEILWVFRGDFKNAFRRFHKDGVMAHVEGEYFRTFYHSLSTIKKAFGKDFQYLTCEGVGALSPPPSQNQFPLKHPTLYPLLNKVDKSVRSFFPFNRWADHIIVTFEYKGLTT